MNEIEYRECLQSKKGKLTSDEKKWLATHPIYNDNFGCSVLRADCIIIDPKVAYLLTVKMESNNTSLRITPTISVPLRKGYMKVNGSVYNVDRIVVPQNEKIYILSTCNSEEHPTSQMEYYSDLGCLEVSYDCEVTDHRGYKYWGSSKMIRGLGMQKEQVSNSKVMYKCNDVIHKTFESYIFSVEWHPL